MIFKTIKNQKGGGALILTMITVLILSVIISQMPIFLSNSAKDFGSTKRATDAIGLQNAIAKVVLEARRLGVESQLNGETNCNTLPGGLITVTTTTNNLFCFSPGVGSNSCVADYTGDGSAVCINQITLPNGSHLNITLNTKNLSYMTAKISRDKKEVLKYKTYHALNNFFNKLEKIKIANLAYANDPDAQDPFEPNLPAPGTFRNDTRKPNCAVTNPHPLCQRCDSSSTTNCILIEIDDDKYGVIQQKFIVEI